jgi:hypothetical protein
MREAELARVRDALASLCALPLPTPGAPPLAISTLRGQFADNGEWCIAPSRPAVVIELTATSRSAKANAKPFGLDENPDDKATDNEIVQGRVNAVKKLSLLPVTKITDGKDKANGADVRAKIVDLALAKKDSDRAVLIFVRSVDLRRR